MKNQFKKEGRLVTDNCLALLHPTLLLNLVIFGAGCEKILRQRPCSDSGHLKIGGLFGEVTYPACDKNSVCAYVM